MARTEMEARLSQAEEEYRNFEQELVELDNYYTNQRANLLGGLQQRVGQITLLRELLVEVDSATISPASEADD